jgi:hypothetical protein
MAFGRVRPMHVEYVYHGSVLELYSLALLKPNIEHSRVTASRDALALDPARLGIQQR